MSVYVDRKELEAGKWYVVQSGSVMIPMKLEAWLNGYTVEMTTRGGKTREVSTLRIRDGYNPETEELIQLRKSGEDTEPKTEDDRRARDLRAAAEVKPNGTAHRILEIFDELREPSTDEVAIRMLNVNPSREIHPSTFRGSRNLLTRVGYLECADRSGYSSKGKPMYRHRLTDRGREKLSNLRERAQS